MPAKLTVLLIAIVAALATPPAAGAATYVVDRTDDPLGAGACTAAANDCSLGQAMTLANAAAGADTVELGTARYLTTGINVIYPLTLAGAGARATIVQASGLAVNVPASGAVELRDMTITGGRNGGPGFSAGVWGRDDTTALNLTLRRVAILDNEASGDPQFGTQHYPGVGAGVRWEGSGTLTVEDSLVAGNHAIAGSTGVSALGAGLAILNGSVVIRNSTITGNVAAGRADAPAQGAGIYVSDGRTLELDNVTLAGNTVVGGSDPTLGGTEGAQLWRGPTSAVTVKGSIIGHGANAAASDCNRAVTTSGGGNIQDRNDCGLGPSDRISTDPLLGLLVNNGGPTDTLAIAAASPAVGLAGTCGLTADQRGIPRAAGACDAGAFQFVAPPVVAPVVVPPPKPLCSMLASGDSAGLRVLAICDLPVTATLSATARIRPLAAKRRATAAAIRLVMLKPVSGGLVPGRFGTLRLKVPTTVRDAVAHGHRVSVLLSLAATTGAGATGVASAAIGKLKRAPAKAKHR